MSRPKLTKDEYIAELEKALDWALDNGGWDLWYYGSMPYPLLVDANHGKPGNEATRRVVEIEGEL